MIFPYPNRFLPERWRTFNSGDIDKLYTFGAGIHSCLGERFMWQFMTKAAKALVKTFTWDFEEGKGSERNLKYVPVLRPREPTKVLLRQRPQLPESSKVTYVSFLSHVVTFF